MQVESAVFFRLLLCEDTHTHPHPSHNGITGHGFAGSGGGVGIESAMDAGKTCTPTPPPFLASNLGRPRQTIVCIAKAATEVQSPAV